MPPRNLKDKYLYIIYSKWTNKDSYKTVYGLITQYAEEYAVQRGIDLNKNPQFILKISHDFEKEVYRWLFLVKRDNWKKWLASDDTLKLHHLEYEVQFYAFYEVRKKLYDLIDLWVMEEFEAKKPIKKHGLEGLAADDQNVHTQAVNNQTHDGLAIIRKAIVPKGQKTLDEILNAWVLTLPHSVENLSPVYEDMQKWGNTRSIIKKGDWEYRKALRSLWAKIKGYDGELRTELTKRLWEECYESVGMCAQGHLSRLANVLVGFDETIRPPISKAQEFQERISHIAKQDTLSTEEKVQKAETLMDELDMPLDERQVWLDAF